jgi:Mn2+/Fe2+ NRAMP family transporter
MGEQRNSPGFNLVSWATVVLMTLLTLILIYLGLTGADVSLSHPAD